MDTKTIAELAKKSIRLTTENRKLQDELDEIKEMAEIQIEENKQNLNTAGRSQILSKNILRIINGVKGEL